MRNRFENEHSAGRTSPSPSDQASRSAGIAVFKVLLCVALLPTLSLSARATTATLLTTSMVAQDGSDGPDRANGPDNAGSPDNPGGSTASSGPVRLARFSYLKGDVTWRMGTDGSWSSAARNLPLRQGAQIWSSDGGRAEIQFDDGSRVRLNSNTLITLQTLYSDADGEFTEITLGDGDIYLRLNTKVSLYQVNTSMASLKATGPARLRVGTGDGSQFGVRAGQATIDGPSGKVTVNSGEYVDLVDGNSPYDVRRLPSPDDWDAWNDARDNHIDDPQLNSREYLPPNIAIVAGDLGYYGTWHRHPRYGWVWAPKVTDVDWRPYSSGHWTWVEPFGWTWVADEPWGWAPYHYGTWCHESYGWAWVPGPATQYWSPAVVSFCEGGTRVAWCPLAPGEVRYPATLAIGFRGGDWSAFFSIGGAAVYYPTDSRICEPHPWGNRDINRFAYVNNVADVTVNHNTYLAGNFVSVNVQIGGGTQVEVAAFAGRGVYEPVTRTNLDVFTHGRVIGAPAIGQRPILGPRSVAVTARAFTPTRTYQSTAPVPQSLVTRAVYRAPLPSRVPATAAAPLPDQHFSTRAVSESPYRGTSGGSSGLQDYLRNRAASHNQNSGGAGTGGNGNSSNGDNRYPGRGGATSGDSGGSRQRDSGDTTSDRGTHGSGTSGRSADTYRPLHSRSHSTDSSHTGDSGRSSHSGDRSNDKGSSDNHGGRSSDH